GGPAGLAAATLAAEGGASVLLLDEQASPGGQIYRNIEAVCDRRPAIAAALGDDYRGGLELVRAFRRSGAGYRPRASVWEIAGDGALAVVGDGGAEVLRARRLLVATGAAERPVPVPGWTLPGVMTVGAAQTLLKASGLAAGEAVIAGCGPLVLLFALQSIAVGAPPRAVLLSEGFGDYLRALPHLPRAVGSLDLLAKGWGWLRQLKSSGVEVVTGVSAVAARGGSAVDGVGFITGGGRRDIDAGLLLLHQGLVPNGHLLRAAGCAQEWDPAQACWRTRRNSWGATSRNDIAVAGDCAGIGGALAAAEAGRLSALDALYRLGHIGRAARNGRALPMAAALRRHLRPRPLLEALYRPPAEVLRPTAPDTVVCRCEGVRLAALTELRGLGVPGPNQAKAFSRCGMGPCQGRLCEATVGRLLSDEPPLAGRTPQTYTIRPPARPVTVGQVAALDGLAEPAGEVSGMLDR
ncbi:MAG: FAD-dependent oxidoreductase, partial [Alphaproteobacteria bacterium]|nr:FAD-dependent oxidoreductase [Alphaproteobacteria bacterium]